MRRKSILQEDENICKICGSYRSSSNPLEMHHVFGGFKYNKKASEKYKLVVYLCIPCHRTGEQAVHRPGSNDNADNLHKEGQQAFEANYGTREYFTSIFGRNYL